MKENELASVVAFLEKALEMLNTAGREDNRIFPIYAEYFTALKLTRLGFEVEVVNRRSYDILVDGKIRIEVKTGKYEYGYAGASFYKGNQITEGKFHYCVFVTYEGLKVREIYIFSKDELEEVARKPRAKTVVRYPKTNPCIILKYDSLEDYYRSLAQQDRLEIEVKLNEHPDEFLNRWDKIATE